MKLSQIPLNRAIAGADGLATVPWSFWFNELAQNVSESITSGEAIPRFTQGVQADMGTPKKGDVFLASDLGLVFVEHEGAWAALTGALDGDVSKDAGSSTVTLKVVNGAVGTFGSSTKIPKITLDNKGRVLDVTEIGIGAAGPTGSVQFNFNGTSSGTSDFVYDTTTGTLRVRALSVGGAIARENVFIQPVAPVVASGTYLWIETEIGIDDSMTFWIHDGV